LKPKSGQQFAGPQQPSFIVADYLGLRCGK